MKRAFIFFLIIFIWSDPAFSTTYYSIAGHTWSHSRNGLGCNCTPDWTDPGDTVILTRGTVVTNPSKDVNSVVVIESGAKWLQTGKNARLNLGSGAFFSIEKGGLFKSKGSLTLSISDASFSHGGNFVVDGKTTIIMDKGSKFNSELGSAFYFQDNLNINSADQALFQFKGKLKVGSRRSSANAKIKLLGGNIEFLKSFDGTFTGDMDITLLSGGAFLNQGKIDTKGHFSMDTYSGAVLEMHGSLDIGGGSAFTLRQSARGTLKIQNGTPPVYHLYSGDINNTKQVANGTRDWSKIGTPVVTWNGKSWSHGGSLIGNLNGVIEGDFSTSVGGSLCGEKLTIKNGYKVSIERGDSLALRSSVTNNGMVELACGAQVTGSSGTFAGDGTITVSTCFSRGGWHYLGFPVRNNSSLPFSSLVPNNMNLTYGGSGTNIYLWNAGTSNWDRTTQKATLGSQSMAINVKTFPAKLTLTMNNSDFSNTTQSQSYTYNYPTGDPKNGTGWASVYKDGWNMLYNPFQSNLDWDKVAKDLGSDFNGTAVYLYDGKKYTPYNRGSAKDEFRYIEPHQAFFVRTDSLASGSFSFNSDHRSIKAGTSFFRTRPSTSNLILELTGKGDTLSTEVVENPMATNKFDSSFDAYFLMPNKGVPTFFSVGQDSTAYGINQVQSLENGTIYLSFGQANEGETYEISLSYNTSIQTNIFLEDLYTGEKVDLRNGNHTFTYKESAPVQRFKLHFSSNSMGMEESWNTERVRLWASKDGIRIEPRETTRTMSAEVFDISGRKLYSGQFQDVDSIEIPTEVRGALIVRLTLDGRSVLTKRIIRQ